MHPEYKNIERYHQVVVNSLANRHSKLSYNRTLVAISRLCTELSKTKTDETVWYIGQDTLASLDSLIVGAFWFTAEHYSGQGSVEYKVHCELSGIYKPNMSNGVEPESSESDVYELLELKSHN